MGKFCENCGKEMTDDMMYCSECGNKVYGKREQAELMGQQPQPTSQQIPPQSKSQSVQKPAIQSVSNVDKTTKVVGIGAYFGLMLLYAIPIIGFIICIIMAFVPKNKNIKNHARAMLIWLAIGFVICGVLIGIITSIVKSVTETINEFVQYGEIFEQFDDVQETMEQFGEFSDIMEQFSESDSENITDQFNEGDLEDIINQFSEGDLEDIMNQFSEGDLEDWLNNFVTE